VKEAQTDSPVDRGATAALSTVHERETMRILAPIVALAVALALSSAPAANAYTAMPGGSITAISNGRLTFRSLLATTQCDVRLIGWVSTSLTINSTMGAITTTSFTNCLGGITIRDLIATRGTWPITLNWVIGMPATGVLFTISNVTFALSSPPCLYGGSIYVQLTEPSAMSLLAGAIFDLGVCGRGSGSFSGSFTLSPGMNIT
jgi:hypothetical protein